MSWGHTSDPIKGMTTNVFIAAFTTAMACLKLYESLERVQQQVLYYDTDSVVCRWKPGDPEILLGDHLGEDDKRVRRERLDGGVCQCRC